jgi:hypothetical protein
MILTLKLVKISEINPPNKGNVTRHSGFLVKPYGVSDETMKLRDLPRGTVVYDDFLGICELDFRNTQPTLICLENRGSITGGDRNTAKKVVILPDQFDNKDITDLMLIDGNQFEVYTVCGKPAHLPNGKVIISKLENTALTPSDCMMNGVNLDKSDIAGENNDKDIPKQMYTEGDMLESYYAGVKAGKGEVRSKSFLEFIKDLSNLK